MRLDADELLFVDRPLAMDTTHEKFRGTVDASLPALQPRTRFERMTLSPEFIPTKTVFYFRARDRWPGGNADMITIKVVLRLSPGAAPELEAQYYRLILLRLLDEQGAALEQVDKVAGGPPARTESSLGGGLYVFERDRRHVRFELAPVVHEDEVVADGDDEAPWLVLRAEDLPPGVLHTVTVPSPSAAKHGA